MIGDPRVTEMTRPRLLTRKQAAERVGKSEGTIRHWIKNGLRERLGGKILESELLAMERTMRERRGRPRLVDPREAVLDQVRAERERQIAKGWDLEHDDEHGPAHLAAQLHRRSGAVLIRDRDAGKARAQLVEVAAMAVAAIELIDRREAVDRG